MFKHLTLSNPVFELTNPVHEVNRGDNDPALGLLQYKTGPCDSCGLRRQLKLLDGRFVCLVCMNTQGE